MGFTGTVSCIVSKYVFILCILCQQRDGARNVVYEMRSQDGGRTNSMSIIPMGVKRITCLFKVHCKDG